MVHCQGDAHSLIIPAASLSLELYIESSIKYDSSYYLHKLIALCHIKDFVEEYSMIDSIVCRRKIVKNYQCIFFPFEAIFYMLGET